LEEIGAEKRKPVVFSSLQFVTWNRILFKALFTEWAQWRS